MRSEKPVTLPLPGTRWRGLTVQMFAVVVVPLTVLLLAISFGGAYLHQSAMRNLVGERDQRAVVAAADALNEQLMHRASAIRTLALRLGEGVPAEDALISSTFLLQDFDRGLGVFSPEGELLASAGDSPLWESTSADTKAAIALQLSVAQIEPAFSQPIDAPEFGEPVLLVAARASGAGLIAIGAFTPLSQSFEDTFPESEASTIYVVTSEYNLVYGAGEGKSPDFLRTHPGVAEALAGRSGTTYYEVGGDELVVAYSPIPVTGWALVIEEPWESVASPLLRTTEITPLVLVPAILLAIVALWFGARQIVQPLIALEARAAALAWGDYQAVEQEVGGIAEIGRLQRTLIHLANQVQRAQQGLRNYIGAITAGQEEERLRIARELHDDTIQSLIALNQKVQLAQMREEAHPSTSLSEISTMTGQIIQDLRRLTKALRPLYLEDLGLVAALDMLAQETDQDTLTAISMQARGAELRLPPEIELAFYRIAQEALSNMLRHAGAKTTLITLSFSPNELEMTITDDGKGFEIPESPAEFAPRGHYGLLGIYERTELIGAKLEINAAPGAGTELAVTYTFPKGIGPE